jgi:hypothetical protein
MKNVCIRAFSSEVDTGSREENASNEEVEPPFRFYRNGKGSRRTRRGNIQSERLTASGVMCRGPGVARRPADV